MTKDPNIDHKKKNQANIFVHELSKLTYERDLLPSLLAQKQANNTTIVDKGKLVSKSDKTVEKLGKYQSSIINTALIGKRYHSMTQFLLAFENNNKKVHNCLVDSRSSSNVMPYALCQKINMEPLKTKA
jgi:hypothetical protein